MIDWVVVLAALCVGLALAAGWSARQETLAHPTTRLFVWVVPVGVVALAAAGAGLSAWEDLHGRADSESARAVALPAGLSPVTAADPGQPTAAADPARGATAAFAPAESLPEPASLPRLIIPDLNVDAPVGIVPLRAGVWDVDALGTGVGLLETTGARPGDQYAMTLIGHMTLSAIQRGPFAELQHIRVGAQVLYQIGAETYVYVVREKGRMETDDVNRLYLADGRSLLLLTCTDWDYATRTYAKRLLVRAELVERRQMPPEGAEQP